MCYFRILTVQFIRHFQHTHSKGQYLQINTSLFFPHSLTYLTLDRDLPSFICIILIWCTTYDKKQYEQYPFYLLLGRIFAFLLYSFCLCVVFKNKFFF